MINKLNRIWKFTLVISISWTFVIITLVIFDFYSHRKELITLAKNTAQASFIKDLAFRKWASFHGGVYVPIDSLTPPNPYLSFIEERDIETPSGKKLTLMNPAYMMRQMNESFTDTAFVTAHITSLNPLRPENKATDWEQKALLKFNSENDPFIEIIKDKDAPQLHYMAPLITEKSCLKCHAHQGYSLGDIRGGIGITLSLKTYFLKEKQNRLISLFAFSLVWLIGLFGLVFGSRKLNKEISNKDVTDQKLNLYIKQTSIGIIEWDTNYKVASWNHAAENIFGYTVQEALKKNFTFIVPDYISIEMNKVWEDLMQNKSENKSINENVKKNGDIIYCEWFNTPLIDSNSNLIGITSHVQDVTERELAKSNLKVSQNKYKLLFENMTVGFALHQMIYDEEGKAVDYMYLEANSEFGKLTGFDVSTIAGKTVKDFMPNLEPYWLETFNKVAETGEPTMYENYAEELKKHYETWVFSPEKGQFAVMVNDITKRKQIENELKQHKQHLEFEVKERTEELETINEELRAINEELYDKNNLLSKQKESIENTLNQLHQTQAILVQSEKMVSLGTLTAGVAHEINNPINFINSSIYGIESYLENAEMILSNYDKLNEENFKIEINHINKLREDLDFDYNRENIMKIVHNINSGTERIINIVSSLRDFSFMDDLKRTTNIHDNIDTTLTILQYEIKERIVIEKNYGNIPDVSCYSGKINQVFMNILSNAIQSISGKGKIKISTWNLENTEEICISIKDNGKGIPKEKQEKIFEPFYTTKKEGQGTGLGLYISYGVIEQHKGKIEVISEENSGTEFRIFLPVK